MVDHHDARAVQPLGLVHEQVAALVVHVVGDDKALCETDACVPVNCCPRGATSQSDCSYAPLCFNQKIYAFFRSARKLTSSLDLKISLKP